ncbi:IclR family transcriptional regulator [Gluconacetobacter diazotrophicus]|uniref:IclR family transcriptional regulator n=2 Tax=Gluconacetobacter diazotrophicus TaxID=33996 RepID=A0A7W4I3L0_GLUDI|nr:IclR family transcriptional regulator [Gluconacetobacter diazotrophicus]
MSFFLVWPSDLGREGTMMGHNDGKGTAASGTQALERGIAIVDAVDSGHRTLPAIATATGCTRSTTQRIVQSLVRLNWLLQQSDGTYDLGPRLAALSQRARAETSLATLARPVAERLGAETRDTVHVGVRSGADILYLDKIPGQRGLEMRSRVGQRMRLALTGIGRALMLDLDEDEWGLLFDAARPDATPDERTAWVERMRAYRAEGCVFDLEDNEIGIRCVAAPVRDRDGRIVVALSVASATPYLSPVRMQALAPVVRRAAADLSARLGWRSDVRAA